MESKRYNTGKPCKYGHYADRLKSNKCCVECAKLKLRRWQIANPDKVRALDRARHYRDKAKRNAALREYAKRNAKTANERKKAWTKKNRDKAWAIQKKWNAVNRHKINAYAANRRCLIKGRGKHTGDDIKALYCLQNGKCALCKKSIENWHVDHITPISKGGMNTKDNLQLLCKKCNLRKGAKLMDEFISLLRIDNG